MPGIAEDNKYGAESFNSVPRLGGLVGLWEDGEVVGLPTTWIQTTNEPAELAELDMLRNDMDTISFSRTEKWVGQIKQAIEHLHSQVVIWGDANTKNVMVDGETMRCWLTLVGG